MAPTLTLICPLLLLVPVTVYPSWTPHLSRGAAAALCILQLSCVTLRMYLVGALLGSWPCPPALAQRKCPLVPTKTGWGEALFSGPFLTPRGWKGSLPCVLRAPSQHTSTSQPLFTRRPPPRPCGFGSCSSSAWPGAWQRRGTAGVCGMDGRGACGRGCGSWCRLCSLCDCRSGPRLARPIVCEVGTGRFPHRLAATWKWEAACEDAEDAGVARCGWGLALSRVPARVSVFGHSWEKASVAGRASHSYRASSVPSGKASHLAPREEAEPGECLAASSGRVCHQGSDWGF